MILGDRYNDAIKESLSQELWAARRASASLSQTSSLGSSTSKVTKTTDNVVASSSSSYVSSPARHPKSTLSASFEQSTAGTRTVSSGRGGALKRTYQRSEAVANSLALNRNNFFCRALVAWSFKVHCHVLAAFSIFATVVLHISGVAVIILQLDFSFCNCAIND